MKYTIGLLIWFLSLNLFNFQLKNSIFKIFYNHNIFTLRLSNDSSKKSYNKLFQSLIKCLAKCSSEEICFLVQLNQSEKSCSFYSAIEENAIKTTIDDNSIIYRKTG